MTTRRLASRAVALALVTLCACATAWSAPTANPQSRFSRRLTLTTAASTPDYRLQLATPPARGSRLRVDGASPLQAETPGTRERRHVQAAAQEPAPVMNKWNLGLRFALELSALGAMGWWGQQQTDGAGRYALMVGVPVAGAAAWGTFAVKGDSSRSGKAPIAVSGPVRLGLELAIFGFATWALNDMDEGRLGAGLASVTVVHYAMSYRRVAWLLGR